MRNLFWCLLLLGCGSATLTEHEHESRASISLQPCAALDEFLQLPACSDPALCSWYAFQTATPDDAAHDLQAALDTVLARATAQPVLFIPKGTYTLRTTVRLLNAVGVSIVGEDPKQTVLRWAGPSAGQMFMFDGVSNIKVSRLSLVGGGGGVGIQQVRSRCPALPDGTPDPAQCPANHPGIYSGSSSQNEYADLRFSGFTVGFLAGDYYATSYGGQNTAVAPYPEFPLVMDSQQNNDTTLLRRCLFDHTSRGVAISGLNALAWDIWDSTFRANQYGITVTQAAANSWRNSFDGSAVSDHLYAGAIYAELRENRSSGSAAFFAGSSVYAAQLIDNLIVSAASQTQYAPIFGTMSQLLLLRNQLATPPGVPAVYVDSMTLASRYVVTHGDNKLSGPLADFLKTTACCGSTVASIDLTDLPQQQISPPAITDPLHPAKANRPLPALEVDPTWKADKINLELAAAAPNSIVHFRAATYVLDKTLQVPGGKNLAIVGDGIFTRLVAKRSHVAPGEPVFDVAAPALGDIRDLRIGYDSAIPFYSSTGVRVHTAADDNGFIYLDTLIPGTVKTGVDVQRLDNMSVRLDHPLFNAETAIRVDGNGLGAQGSTHTRGVRAYGGVVTPLIGPMALSNWGKALYEGTDFEVGAQAQAFDGSGWATIAGGRYITSALPAGQFSGTQNFTASGFQGAFTFADAATTSGFDFTAAPAASLLVLGARFSPISTGCRSDYWPTLLLPPFSSSLPSMPGPLTCTFARTAGAQQARVEGWTEAWPQDDTSLEWCPSNGNPPTFFCAPGAGVSPTFIKGMLGDLENAGTGGTVLFNCGSTDLRVHRLTVEGRLDPRAAHHAAITVVRDN